VIPVVWSDIHGKGMLDRALLGNTVERVVRAARWGIGEAKAGTSFCRELHNYANGPHRI